MLYSVSKKSKQKFRIFDQWVKKMAIFVLINARANGNMFRVKKSDIPVRSVFRHPVISFLNLLKRKWKYKLDKKNLAFAGRSATNWIVAEVQ